MKAVLIFVEGSADGWYVCRCLGQHCGAQFDSRRPADFETPFGQMGGNQGGGFIARWHARIAADDLRLAEGSEGKEPVFQAALRTTDTLFLIVRMGGDRKIVEVQKLIFALRDLFKPNPVGRVQELALAFLYDADNPSHYKGGSQDCVAEREALFLQDSGTLATFDALAGQSAQYALLGTGTPTHAQWVQGTDFPVGLFVMHDPTTRQGTLESAIEPALQAQAPWDTRLVEAEKYLGANEVPTDKVVTDPRARSKARITSAGQFNGLGESLAQLFKGGPNALMPGSCFQGPAAVSLATFLQTVPWPIRVTP